MKTKLITIVTSLVAACGLLTIFAAPAPASAVDICNNTNIPEEVRRASGCTIGGSQDNYDLTNVIQNIINSVILVLGTLAVVLIIIGGIGYMTSSGDAGRLKKAKDTILYACVGLVICVLSFAITNFVINIIGGNVSTTTTQQPAGAGAGGGGDGGGGGAPLDQNCWNPDTGQYDGCE